ESGASARTTPIQSVSFATVHPHPLLLGPGIPWDPPSPPLPEVVPLPDTTLLEAGDPPPVPDAVPASSGGAASPASPASAPASTGLGGSAAKAPHDGTTGWPRSARRSR